VSNGQFTRQAAFSSLDLPGLAWRTMPLTDSVKPEVLDNVILLTRLGKMLNYQAR
jgi:hypothetical protein